MTRIAISKDETVLYVEHEGTTTCIGNRGLVDTDPWAKVDDVLKGGYNLLFDNTKPEPLSVPNVGDFITITHRDGVTHTGHLTRKLIPNLYMGVELDGAWAGYMPSPSESEWREPHDTDVVAWSFAEPEPVKVPAVGMWIRATMNNGSAREFEVTMNDDELGCLRLARNPDYTYVCLDPKDYLGRGSGRWVKSWVEIPKPYAVGDTLPAGEPMPANGVVEHDDGSRLYRDKGVFSHFDRKIIWLEDSE